MRVGLYATCLVDLVRPNIAWSALELLEAAGCEVVVPEQTCCGQPAFNGGERELARGLARQAAAAFGDCDYVVLPSGSCAAMMKRHYPDLLGDEAAAFCAKVFELCDFLVNVLDFAPAARLDASLSYHDSCSGLRDLGIKQQPRRLLGRVAGLRLVEMAEAEQCCGFGGTFAAKFPELSCAIADRKCGSFQDSAAEVLAGGDLGCLLHLEGRLRHQGRDTPVFHIAEVLAGRTER